MKPLSYSNQITLSAFVLLIAFTATNYMPANIDFGTFSTENTKVSLTTTTLQKTETNDSKTFDISIDTPTIAKSIKNNTDEVFNAINDTSSSKINSINTSTGEIVQNSGTLKVPISSTMDILVPFFSQAPKGWNTVTEETCENASLLNAVNYLSNLGLDVNSYYDRLLSLEDEKIATYASNSISMEQLQKIAVKNFPSLNFEVVSVSDVKALRKNLSNGQLIILPAKGKLLGNPYFSNGGPEYHVLVLRGYDENGFFSNDVGTKRGEKYHYTFDTIENSIGDYDGDRDVIIVSKR